MQAALQEALRNVTPDHLEAATGAAPAADLRPLPSAEHILAGMLCGLLASVASHLHVQQHTQRSSRLPPHAAAHSACKHTTAAVSKGQRKVETWSCAAVDLSGWTLHIVREPAAAMASH